jgi:hypothetical protein
MGHTEVQLLGFSYDFGVTVIHHQNDDAMVLAGALLGGFHPPDNIQNDRRPGGNASWARTGWDLAAVTLIDLLCVFVLCQGGDCFCLRYLPNSTYAENNGDGFLYSILSHEDRGFMVLMACNMYF